jgi:hypothetical protein
MGSVSLPDKHEKPSKLPAIPSSSLYNPVIDGSRLNIQGNNNLSFDRNILNIALEPAHKLNFPCR